MKQSEKPARAAPLLAALLLGGLAVASAFYFRSYESQAAPSLLASDALVRVEKGAYGLAFLPAAGAGSLGLAFYPGARVPPEAYAYLARALAAQGYPTVLLSTPLNFAVFAPGKAGAAARAFPEVGAWVLGGHSLGGAMAAARAAKAPGSAAGLLLLAAYPGGGADLSGSGLPVLSVSATNDGLATPAKVQAARSLLPPGARHVVLAGGNHAQFGEYGSQAGDGTAELPAAAQRRAVVQEAAGFLGAVLAAVRP